MDDMARRRSTQTPWPFSVLGNGRPGPKIQGGKETGGVHESAVIIMNVLNFIGSVMCIQR